MMRTITKACTGPGKTSPRFIRAPLEHARKYSSEARDYACGLREGLIEGVDPRLALECPVCTQIFRELYGDEADVLEASTAANIKLAEEEATDLAMRLWLSLWLQHHEAIPVCELDYAFQTNP